MLTDCYGDIAHLFRAESSLYMGYINLERLVSPGINQLWTTLHEEKNNAISTIVPLIENNNN